MLIVEVRCNIFPPAIRNVSWNSGSGSVERSLRQSPISHFTLSISKIIRRYFLYARSLLSELSRCGWESLKVFFQTMIPEGDAVPVEDPVPCGGGRPCYKSRYLLRHQLFRVWKIWVSPTDRQKLKAQKTCDIINPSSLGWVECFCDRKNSGKPKNFLLIFEIFNKIR